MAPVCRPRSVPGAFNLDVSNKVGLLGSVPEGRFAGAQHRPILGSERGDRRLGGVKVAAELLDNDVAGTDRFVSCRDQGGLLTGEVDPELIGPDDDVRAGVVSLVVWGGR